MMTPTDGMRAWGDCPACKGKGWQYEYLERWWAKENNDVGREKFHTTRDCPTCLAHFKALDSAVAEAVAKEREKTLEEVMAVLYFNVFTSTSPDGAYLYTPAGQYRDEIWFAIKTCARTTKEE